MFQKSSHLLHEDDKDPPEDLDEVDEEVERVGDEVPVAAAALLHDHLDKPRKRVECMYSSYFESNPLTHFSKTSIKLMFLSKCGLTCVSQTINPQKRKSPPQR